MEPKLIMTNQEEEETHSLIQTNQSSQAYSNTLVNTLVVSPICMSATIAASVLHAVYVRPVIGLIKVVIAAVNQFHYALIAYAAVHCFGNLPCRRMDVQILKSLFPVGRWQAAQVSH